MRRHWNESMTISSSIFIGLFGITIKVPFDTSVTVYFRIWLEATELNEINELLIAKKKNPPEQGQLILDASCMPQDISHPTDLKLINDARTYGDRKNHRCPPCRSKLYQKETASVSSGCRNLRGY
jgi:hypothetical protein